MIRASGKTNRQAPEECGMSPEEIDEVWGASGRLNSPMVEIVVDEKSVLVSRNLERALRTLRKIPEVRNGTRIFADALCINQDNLQERSFEVKRMVDIYRKAHRVISYLGEGEHRSGDILKLIAMIGEVLQRAEVVAPMALTFFSNIQPDVAVSIAKLFRRSYFSRIWVVQEIVMGSENSVVICSERQFSRENLLRCGKMLNHGLASAIWNRGMLLDLTQVDDENPLSMEDLKTGNSKLQALRTRLPFPL